MKRKRIKQKKEDRKISIRIPIPPINKVITPKNIYKRRGKHHKDWCLSPFFIFLFRYIEII